MIQEIPVKNIRAVFSDLDDTLTEKGFLSADTHRSIEKLIAKGLKFVIVSGRPAGWADCLMRLLPLHAMIFENGAGILVRDGNRIRTETLAKDKDFAEQKRVLESVFQDLKRQIPALKLATDQPYRLCDYALDYAEEPPFLNSNEVDLLMNELAKHKEITAKLSSIHINYWYGSHTKVSACEHLLSKYGADWNLTSKDQILFSGDSPNDEPLFAHFPETVGVANIKRFLDKMKSLPKYITEKEGGEGFQEVAAVLLRG